VSDNLYERNGIWWFKVQIAGVPYRRSLRTRSRPLARKLAAAEIEKIKEFAVTGQQRHLYKEAVLKWTKEFLTSLEPATARRYLSSARQLSPFFADLYIDQIRPATIASYVSHRKAARATDMTIRRDLTALSSILRSCVSWGWSDTNAAKLWDRSTLKESRLAIHRVDQASFDLVKAEAPPALASLMTFLLETGARLEEAASLTRRQLKPGNRVFLEKTKTHQPRTINLGVDAARAVSSQPIDIASDYVFNHGLGSRYSSPSSLFGKVRARAQKAAQKAGVAFRPFRLHDLRHEFAARYLEDGGSIYDLSRHLGHDSVATTERFYLRFLPTEDHEAARKPRAQK
jgi:integrase/recombinase XerD